MDLKIRDKLFIVTGATSGFGYSITKALLNEKAKVMIVARRKERIKQLIKDNPSIVSGITGDITREETINTIIKTTGDSKIDGLVLNAGGPPTGSFIEISREMWDEAYNLLVRWKIDLLRQILPKFESQKYGRVLFIESISVKQPIDNLVLSNTLRLAIVGLSKTLSKEYADRGITFNILAPGSHNTPAIKRIIKKKSEINHINYNEARERMEHEIPLKRLGNPDELASLAIWLLSPWAEYITGQTFSVDGGMVKSAFG